MQDHWSEEETCAIVRFLMPCYRRAWRLALRTSCSSFVIRACLTCSMVEDSVFLMLMFGQVILSTRLALGAQDILFVIRHSCVLRLAGAVSTCDSRLHFPGCAVCPANPPPHILEPFVLRSCADDAMADEHRANSTEQAYADMAAIPFPEEEILNHLGGASTAGSLAHFIVELASALKVPVGSTYLGLLSLASFQAHRTTAQ